MGRLEYVGQRLTLVQHNIDRTTGIRSHEALWTAVFHETEEVAIVTTNYDVLVERGLRHAPRPRVPRPGFNYGEGPEALEGVDTLPMPTYERSRSQGASRFTSSTDRFHGP
jgi:hypothetical protein